MKKGERVVVLVKWAWVCKCGGCVNHVVGEDGRAFLLEQGHYPDIKGGELVFLKESSYLVVDDQRTSVWEVTDNG